MTQSRNLAFQHGQPLRNDRFGFFVFLPALPIAFLTLFLPRLWLVIVLRLIGLIARGLVLGSCGLFCLRLLSCGRFRLRSCRLHVLRRNLRRGGVRAALRRRNGKIHIVLLI